jgi:molybdenum cofactor guanylyltransferase
MDRRQVTGLILAGGRGARMGGADKGLQRFLGKPLVGHIIERLAPQVGPLLISANRNVDTYATFGLPVLRDRTEGFAGPLAGLQAGLAAVGTPFLVTAPCDSPCLPLDLVARLIAPLVDGPALVTLAKAGGSRHPAFLACRSDVRAGLDRYLADGGRKVGDWCARLDALEVLFDDQPDAFANINTQEELETHTKGAPAR